MSKVSSQPQVKLTAIKQVRRNIAKVLTVISEKRIDATRTAFKKSRHMPHDLRAKKNRAFRRKLSVFERKAMTTRGAKKQQTDKLRKYALAA